MQAGRDLHHVHAPSRAKHSTVRLAGFLKGIDLCACQDEPTQMLAEAEETTEGLRQQIIFAREYLKDIKLGPQQACLALHPST